MSEQSESKVEMLVQKGSTCRLPSKLPSTPIDKCVPSGQSINDFTPITFGYYPFKVLEIGKNCPKYTFLASPPFPENSHQELSCELFKASLYLPQVQVFSCKASWTISNITDWLTDSTLAIVKTPTSTQHNPKTTSTDVGSDTNMTVQTTHHHHHRNSTLARERKQGSVN